MDHSQVKAKKKKEKEKRTVKRHVRVARHGKQSVNIIKIVNITI